MTRSVVILTPSYQRRCVISQRDLFLAIGLKAGERGIEFVGASTASGPSVSLNRNRLMHRALLSGAEVGLWIDDDTSSESPFDAADAVLDLVALCSPAWPVLGLNLPNRHKPPGTGTALDMDGALLSPDDEPFDGVRECLRVGFGLTVVHLGWLLDAWPQDQPWFWERQVLGHDGEPGAVSEDYQFCDRVRKCGGRIGYRQVPALRNGDDRRKACRET